MNVRQIYNGKGQWIVFIVEGVHVVEVHSTGLVVSGNDDREDFGSLIHDAEQNRLHSQHPGSLGVRWPEDIA